MYSHVTANTSLNPKFLFVSFVSLLLLAYIPIYFVSRIRRSLVMERYAYETGNNTKHT